MRDALIRIGSGRMPRMPSGAARDSHGASSDCAIARISRIMGAISRRATSSAPPARWRSQRRQRTSSNS